MLLSCTASKAELCGYRFSLKPLAQEAHPALAACLHHRLMPESVFSVCYDTARSPYLLRAIPLGDISPVPSAIAIAHSDTPTYAIDLCCRLWATRRVARTLLRLLLLVCTCRSEAKGSIHPSPLSMVMR
jgi:hypothetical protein